ncbi:rhamnan synthesis F family protein [Synechococcus sp. CC9605]|uniref:rhamnan synthesis F family protein n=1 Tax=Synechococcus sp. (strain CC9605) TaxID=110662 RepID=UPI00005D5625|nr:rhamnan synthesis F family protein [Synechococcus sp. CC9605]ABB33970.1 Lipopolysaccharide biosynthesis protein-like [Synechococcus sp. CC9605]
MDNSLAKQFSHFLSSGDYSSANQIVNQARNLNYPVGLISSWENLLAKTNPGFVHPLDAVVSQEYNVDNLCSELTPDLRAVFEEKISEYSKKNNIDSNLIDKIVELVFDNFQIDTGRIIIPDLTSNDPIANLFHYSVKEYSIDNPDVPEAVDRGVCVSVIDHFLRYGYIEILEGRRHSSLSFSHAKKKYDGNLLYIVDNYDDLDESERLDLKSLQLSKLHADVYSIKDTCVYTHNGSSMTIEQYLFYNISDDHNLCILLKGKTLTRSAAKWIVDIKLEDRTAIFGYSANNGRFCAVTEYSRPNMLISDITNGCIIANSIEVLAVVSSLKDYQTAYGYFHALVLELEDFGVEFNLKREILSESFSKAIANFDSTHSTYWSPFYYLNDYKSSFFPIRRDLVKTWQKQLASIDQSDKSESTKSSLHVDGENSIVKFIPSLNNSVGVVIPFKDKIHLLEDCVKSLILNEEEVALKIYAINNGSIEPKTFEVLDRLKNQYEDLFVCIDFPGEFNYAKINNYAVDFVEEEYLLFLNNDIVIESSFAVTTLLKTHCFYNAVITGSKLLYPSGKIQHNGLSSTMEKHIAINSPFSRHYTHSNHGFSLDHYVHPWERTHECSAVTAACMIMKKEEFLRIDGFDEDFKVAYNDVDLCFRATKEYHQRPIICSTEVKIYHLESESRGDDNDDESGTRLYHERVNLVSRHEDIFSRPDKFTGVSTVFNNLQKIVKTSFDRKFIDHTSKPSSDIELDDLVLHQVHNSMKQRYACIFVHYDIDPLITDDCVYHLEKLSEYCDIFFVSSSECLANAPEEVEKIKPLCSQILIRKNSGYDFGCWSHVIRKNYARLCNYEGVLLANDSNWGPLNDFSDTFARINRYSSEADFMGLTSSITPSWHLQSFFIFYSRKVFSSSFFKLYWFNIGILDSKYEIIMNYEVGWSARLVRLGFKGIALYGTSEATNPTHVNWESLLRSRYPYLKKELIRDNPLKINLDNLPNILRSQDLNWQASILDYLKRYNRENSETAKLFSSSKSSVIKSGMD